jgi:hypothetical protein
MFKMTGPTVKEEMAVFEFPMPQSCGGCGLIWWTDNTKTMCGALAALGMHDESKMTVDLYGGQRLLNCPLKKKTVDMTKSPVNCRRCPMLVYERGPEYWRCGAVDYDKGIIKYKDFLRLKPTFCPHGGDML